MKKKVLGIILLVAGMSFATQAQTVYNLGINVSSNWSQTGLWTGGIVPGTGAAKDDIANLARAYGNASGSRVLTNDAPISLGGIYIGCTGTSNGRLWLSPTGSGRITFTNLTGGSAFIVKTNNTNTGATGTDVINTPITLGSNLSISNRSSYGMLTINGAISETGSRSITIDNVSTGAVSMTVSNSYSGGTTLTRGKLYVDNNGAFGTGTVNIQSAGDFTLALANTTMKNNFVNDGKMTIGGNAGLFGNISGAGSIYHNAAGAFTLNLAGDNSSFSGTITNAGILEFRGAKALGTAKIVLGDGINAGSFALNTSSNATGANAVKNAITLVGNGNSIGNNLSTLELAGVIAGTADLTKNGGGKVILSGTNTYSGATIINFGTLQVGNGGASGKLGGDSVTNNASLVFNRSDVFSVDNVISGTGSLTNIGIGTLKLTAVNTYTGATAVVAGKLVVDGSLASQLVTVNGGATLGGTGTVQAVTVLSGGTLAAGNSPGTMIFDGALVLSAGSTNVMEIWSGTSYDILQGAATNALTLAGLNQIDFTGWTTPGVTNGTTFNLFQNWSAINTNGATFTFVNLANLGLTGSQTLEATGTGFTVIPEPATIGMLGLGALVTLLIRRMRTA